MSKRNTRGNSRVVVFIDRRRSRAKSRSVALPPPPQKPKKKDRMFSMRMSKPLREKLATILERSKYPSAGEVVRALIEQEFDLIMSGDGNLRKPK